MHTEVTGNTAFFRAQCGNYNPQTKTGFISGTVLRSNLFEHEAGTIAGHYQQYRYVSSLAGNNIGTIAEEAIGAPGSDATFLPTVSQDLNNAASRIAQATHAENGCNTVVNHDTSCQFRGPINYAPYKKCTK
jgi:hypothetical protein